MSLGLALEPFPLAALALALVIAASPAVRRWLWQSRLDRFVWGASVAAAAISAAYVAAYLRGGPRIIDATTYYLEARAISEGKLSWPESDPSEVGRFLVRDVAHGRVAGIFPPGYPAVLAIGFWLGAPMAIGPCLAFAVTWATGALARAASAAGANADGVSRVAVLLSVVCGALRYHTADTMSHGLAAVCVATGLALAYRLRAGPRARDALAAGASLGLLLAARPFSGLALALVMGFVIGRALRVRSVAFAALGALPFIVLLGLHQHAATGAWLQSSQAAYYASSDGPGGCFRYGFGAGVGCLHEHGDFVRHNLERGYGAVAAAGTTLRRLKMHGVDALNAEPLALVLLVPAFVVALGRRSLRSLALLPIALVAVYAPFYFDGNYPAGGARFFADGLPVEHVLVAWFWVTVAIPWAQRVHRRLADPHWLVVASLIGFATRADVDHRALRDREGGRPMYEANAARSAGAEGLLFVDTDHGFGLAFDPAASERGSASLRVARQRADHFDWLVWQAAGRPPAFRYDYDIESGRVSVTPFEPRPMAVIEAAHLWPPLSQQGGFALPAYGALPECPDRGRRLELFANGEGPAVIDLALPSALVGSNVAPIVTRGPPGAVIELRQGETLLATWPAEAGTPPCHPSSPVVIPERWRGGVDSGAFMLRVRLPAAAENPGLGLAAIAVAVDK